MKGLDEILEIAAVAVAMAGEAEKLIGTVKALFEETREAWATEDVERLEGLLDQARERRVDAIAELLELIKKRREATEG